MTYKIALLPSLIYKLVIKTKNDKYETLIVLNAEENAEYCIVLN